MPNVITIDVLRQVANDSISIYDALRRAQTFTEESQRIAIMAEYLLRQAGLAYLLDSSGIKAMQASNSSNASGEMISAYIRIQQTYADLKDTLYRLAIALIEIGASDKAYAIMEALLKLDPQYRDVANMLRQPLLNQAKFLFEQGKWDEGRAILKQRPIDKELRLAYLSSFLDKNPLHENALDFVPPWYLYRILNGVRAVQTEEPRVESLPSFQRTINLVNELSTLEYRPLLYNVPNTRPFALILYEVREALTALRAELSSII